MQASRCFYSHKSTDKAVGFSWAGGPCPYGAHGEIRAFQCMNITSKSNFKNKTGTVALCVNNQCVLELLAKRVSAFL